MASADLSPKPPQQDRDAIFDAVIVGAGFAGLYMLYRLRQAGMSARIYEQADNVGGTWYWNRYPGARCDAESLAYSYSFDETLEQRWEWSERYATQPEILRYAEHVADHHGLRQHIRFERTVTRASFDNASSRWIVETAAGDRAIARLCIMATGCLSVPQVPDIPGLDDFSGQRYQASQWPHSGVDFSGQRVGVIGTGSSAIQAIPVIAEQAAQLTVFQRTPNFSVPARNGKLDPDWVAAFKKNYRAHRAQHRRALSSGFGDLEIEPRDMTPNASGRTLTDAQLHERCEAFWNIGGARFLSSVNDALADETVNERIAEFVRSKIRETVRDPVTAAALCPTDHPIGTKRICVDSNYYETYNLSHVALVNLRQTPIERITAAGIQLTADRHVDLDTLVLATGFDAMTGALNRIDISGSTGARLRDKWAAGPMTYLGLMTAGFPNLFMITGPGSPSVLSNMLVSIEQHVDFIMDCLSHAQRHDAGRIEPELAAEEAWVKHVNDIAGATLFPKGGSWYLGANVPGKTRVFMPYAAGVGVYREICEDIARDGFRGFAFR